MFVHKQGKKSNMSNTRENHAAAIAAAGGIEAALQGGALPQYVDTTLAEAIVLGLLRQNVRVFFAVLGHGSTEIGEVLRIYAAAKLVKVCNVRNEIEASHAAMALRWITGEKAAVITSIGPGMLQALAASIAPASDGIGVWYLFGDETSEDEGPNMQQIPKHEQELFLRLCATMGRAYTLHTPLALGVALQNGMNTVDHPYRPGPFYLLMPMNTQPASLKQFNLAELPCGTVPGIGAAADGLYEKAAKILLHASKIVVKLGGGARKAQAQVLELLDLVDAVAVHTPIASGIVPYQHKRNMAVGGSKGSLCGNYAMENADVLVAIGTRFVCQSDSSRTGYPLVQHVININTDLEAAMHYARTIALTGDAALTLQRLITVVKQLGGKHRESPSPWITDCSAKRNEWETFKARRYNTPVLYDKCWGKNVLTQPVVIKIATDWARANDIVCCFDAGDVQANGFQIVEDDRPNRTFTETGASYMGFAASALLATGVASKPFYALALVGDGSFTMNPQILLDGVEHKAQGCILLLDNRRMGAISGLQRAQYGVDFATNDTVAVDYVGWARSVAGVQALSGGNNGEELIGALRQARSYNGLTLIHVPVYFGPDELGGMGAFGRWNVGNWCAETQALRHKIGL